MMEKKLHKGGKLAKALLALQMLLAVVLLGGCVNHPINGDLDGQWQVMNIEKGGEDLGVVGQRYICVQLHVVQLTQGGIFATGNLHYTKGGDTIGIDFPEIEADTSDFVKLSEWGVYENPVTFHIEELTRKRLVMSCGDVRVTCRKF